LAKQADDILLNRSVYISISVVAVFVYFGQESLGLSVIEYGHEVVVMCLEITHQKHIKCIETILAMGMLHEQCCQARDHFSI
jgi:hypothetical protein